MKTKHQSIPSARAGQNIGKTSNNQTGLRRFSLRLGGFVLIAVCSLFPVARAQAAADAKAPYIRAGHGRSDVSKTLDWDAGADHPYAEVWVSVDGADETKVVEQAKGTRRITVEPGKTYLYILSDANERLATVTVKAEGGTAIPASKPAATPGINAWVGRWTSVRDPGGDFEITFQLSGDARLTGTFRDRRNSQNYGYLSGKVVGNVLTYGSVQTGGGKCNGTFTMLDTSGMTIDGQGVSRSAVGEEKFHWTGWKMK